MDAKLLDEIGPDAGALQEERYLIENVRGHEGHNGAFFDIAE
jgi:hypothetical protein